MRTKTSMLSTTLLDEARRRLRVALRDQSYRTIQAATGLSPTWLCTLIKGGYLDPDAAKIETLISYLTGETRDENMTSWIDEARLRLQNRQIWMTAKKIQEETGLGADWINNFASGKIPNPGINKIESLLVYLRKNEHAIR